MITLLRPTDIVLCSVDGKMHTIKIHCEYCLGVDSDLPDIMECDLEGPPETICYLEESWESQGTPFY